MSKLCDRWLPIWVLISQIARTFGMIMVCKFSYPRVRSLKTHTSTRTITDCFKKRIQFFYFLYFSSSVSCVSSYHRFINLGKAWSEKARNLSREKIFTFPSCINSSCKLASSAHFREGKEGRKVCKNRGIVDTNIAAATTAAAATLATVAPAATAAASSASKATHASWKECALERKKT